MPAQMSDYATRFERAELGDHHGHVHRMPRLLHNEPNLASCYIAPLQAEISYGMYALGVHLLFISFPDEVHWQEKRSVRRIVHYAHAFDAE